MPLLVFAALYDVLVIIPSLPGNEYLIFNFLEYASKNMILINTSIIAVATLILLLSFLLSTKLYANRDF